MSKPKVKTSSGVKVLLLDIETSPILAHVWDLWDQNISLSQIKQDWFILSFSAKWLGDPESKIIYHDQRHEKDIENDKTLLKKVWALLDECDVLITQNGKKFDEKKLNARFIQQGMKPHSSIKHVDTCQIAKRKFGFTSNKLEYMTDKLNTKYKKLKHNKFPGFELWSQCLKGNVEAWKEMEHYNKYDILSLEELYLKLQPWDNSINYNHYSDSLDIVCSCGSKSFQSKGYRYTNTGKYKRYICKECGAETKGRKDQFSKEKKATLRVAR